MCNCSPPTEPSHKNMSVSLTRAKHADCVALHVCLNRHVGERLLLSGLIYMHVQVDKPNAGKSCISGYLTIQIFSDFPTINASTCMWALNLLLFPTTLSTHHPCSTKLHVYSNVPVGRVWGRNKA